MSMMRLRPSCTTQAVIGCAVAPRICTRRDGRRPIARKSTGKKLRSGSGNPKAGKRGEPRRRT
jgi:hypothetical protein